MDRIVCNESSPEMRHIITVIVNLPLTITLHSKVTLLEDGEGNIHLKNLSLHSATNEEEGKPILVVG